ncbi:MAG: coproporphyrinogen dehydrogenase HemZ, partial [Clostridia bacterium]|nr:coproporphyrinogen dehydrogenase HemZ [Clostridia bacterium]
KALCDELEEVKKVCDKTGVYVSTVYMGGGTPTTLTAGQMDTVLSKVDELFDVSTLDEFTVEAGRPDTITEEKLDVLRKCGVTRISINPQTMNDKTLERIGRKHTAQDVVWAYELAKSKGFDCINTDLIAGLDTEDEKDFDFTLDKILSMRPENVTVHTLSVKRAANLRDDGGRAIDRATVTEYMTETAQKRLLEAGYRPYYMYKQKNMVGNLENVGYALDDKDGLYNIYIMGEYQTIIAVGAGAVSKVVNAKNGRIERVFNYKYPYEYLDDKQKMLGNIARLEELIRETL